MRAVLVILAGLGAGAYFAGLTGRVADLEGALAHLSIHIEENIAPVIAQAQHLERLEHPLRTVAGLEDLDDPPAA